MQRVSQYQQFLSNKQLLSVDHVVLVRAEQGRLRTFDSDAYVVQALTGNPIRLTRETTLDVEPDQIGDLVQELLAHKFVVNIVGAPEGAVVYEPDRFSPHPGPLPTTSLGEGVVDTAA